MTLARAPQRVAELRAKGVAVAAYLRANPKCFQEQAALSAGVSRKTHYAWLNGDDEACEAYQAEVLPVLYERAAADEEKAEQDIGCVESGSGAWSSWWRWKLAQKHRKVFGDLAQKHEVELTGKDGAPMQHEHRQLLPYNEALVELRKLAQENPEVAEALKLTGGDE